MTFREWLKKVELQEMGTGTSCIAAFARPVFAEPFRRPFPKPLEDENLPPKKKKHRHRHKDLP